VDFNGNNKYITGIAKLGDGMIIILDQKKF
jgi:chemotaxis signal transduction protein